MRIRSCVLLAFLWGAIHSLVADILYSVTDLGNAAHAYGINNAGQVTGMPIRPPALLMPFSTATVK